MSKELPPLLSPKEFRCLLAIWIVAWVPTLLIGLLTADGVFGGPLDRGLHGTLGTVAYLALCWAAPAFASTAALLVLLGAAAGPAPSRWRKFLWIGLLAGTVVNLAGVADAAFARRLLWARCDGFGPAAEAASAFFGTKSFQEPAIIWFVLVELPLIYVAVAMLVRGRKACNGCSVPINYEDAKHDGNG